MAYSIQREVSDGTLVLLDISISYIDRDEISVYFDDILQTEGATWAWVGVSDAKISFSPAVANGVEVSVKRVTDLSDLRHRYSEGAAFTANSMDESFEQVLHIAQEATEGSLGGDFFTDINMHTYKIKNLGDAVDPSDAVPLAQYQADALGAGVARDEAEAARDIAVASKDTAVAAAVSASSSASAAATSASSASAAASAASVSTSAASASATAAASSASSASASASTATTKAVETATSATNASASAAAALASENKANEWAEKTSGPVEGSKYSAKYWAEQAADSPSGQFYEGNNTVTVNKTIVNGKNAMTPGPITVVNGPSVVVESGAVWTIV